MQLPDLLLRRDDTGAVDLLRCYFGVGSHAHHGPFAGAHYDTAIGREPFKANVFTAEDLCAVSFLSVNIPGRAAIEILDSKSHELSSLLTDLGPDRDLVEELEPFDDGWVGWSLWGALTSIHDIGPTSASKLIARKRPRLRPIYDTVIAATLKSENLWEPLRARLQEDDLHDRLIRVRDAALPPLLAAQVSAIRTFDVIVWMHGKGYGACPWMTTGDEPGTLLRH